ncbi:MAG: TonB-dependent receptor, partial [Bacteroidetes bacterium]
MCALYGLFAGMSTAQTITVFDEESRLPLEGVVISGDSLETPLITNSQGQADLGPLSEHTLLSFHALGYVHQHITFAELLQAKFRLGLKPQQISLSEVIVTASRWPQRAHEVAVKVRSIRPAEVDLQQPQTAADLLGLTGQIFIQKSQQGGGSPMIRGFAANRLLFAVDGVRMNTAIFREGNLQNVIN